MTRTARRFSTAILSCLVLAGLGAVALAQDNPGNDGARTRGRITSITGNSIDITHRDGSSATIVTTGNTTFVRNGQPASLDDFVAGDFIAARGMQNGNGAFVADAVRGGTHATHPPGRVRGVVVSVDTTAGSITVNTQDGDTEVIYTTPETRIVINRHPATLADFAPGDPLRAVGERDPDDNLIANRILGVSGS
jgi:uncharacterized protein DUF5666